MVRASFAGWPVAALEDVLDAVPGRLVPEPPSQLNQPPDAGKAAEAYREGIDRGVPEAAVNLGGALEQLGQIEEAVDAYRKGIARGDPEAAVRLGGALEALGQVEEATDAYRQGIDRGDPEAAVRLGRVLEQLDRLEEATDAYRQGIDRGDPEAAVRLGGVLERLGRPGEAVDAYGRGVERGDPDARVKLDEALQQLQPAESGEEPTIARPVFINYRREDASGSAGRLYDGLEEELGSDRLFRDLDHLDYGLDFVDGIKAALRSCRVMLVVIGPRWSTVEDDEGRRRLEDPEDVLRMEIEGALKRPNVRLIPVLVEGATMPAASDLPNGLKPLSRRNAMELSDRRWKYDIGVILSQLRTVLGDSDQTPSVVDKKGVDPTENTARRLRTALEGRYPWRTLERLAAEAAIPEATALEMLQADDDVCFDRNRAGKVIAGLASRVRATAS
jgi:tetratricopeptide (TPR) repeat protein